MGFGNNTYGNNTKFAAVLENGGWFIEIWFHIHKFRSKIRWMNHLNLIVKCIIYKVTMVACLKRSSCPRIGGLFIKVCKKGTIQERD